MKGTTLHFLCINPPYARVISPKMLSETYQNAQKKTVYQRIKQGKQLHRSRWIYRMNQAKLRAVLEREAVASYIKLYSREAVCFTKNKQGRIDKEALRLVSCLLYASPVRGTKRCSLLGPCMRSHHPIAITTRAVHFMIIPNQAQTHKSAACSRRQTNPQAKEERKTEETPKQNKKYKGKPNYAK